MRKIITLYILSLCLCMPCVAQNKTINNLKNKRTVLQKKIKKSEAQLQATRNDVKKRLKNLTLINADIEKQQHVITLTQHQIDSITYQITKINMQLDTLRRELKEKKLRYQRSLLYLYKNRKTDSKLLFLLSSSNFTQAMRRYRYVKEYATYQRVNGELLQRKQKEIEMVQQQLDESKKHHTKLLTEQKTKKEELTKKQAEQQKVASKLQKQQKQIQSIINSDKKEMAALDSKIDYYVKKAIEEERRRREADERKRRQLEEQTQTKSTTKKKSSSKSSVDNSSSVEKMSAYHSNNADFTLSSNFTANKGRLPIPITGPYLISAHFGNYSLSGMKNVRLDNKGINITGKSGAKARCIFEGEVSAIFKLGSLFNILIRHGSYISVYCNLSSVSVSKGQKVNAGTLLGPVARDIDGNPMLHFQLRREAATLNPESWIRK